MRRWWLVIALFASLGVNVGILAVMYVQRTASAREIEARRAAGPAPQVARLVDRLGLEGESRERFIGLHEGFIRRTRETRIEVFKMRREIQRQLTARRPDRELVETLLERQARRYFELEKELARVILDTRELLDERQDREYLRFVSRMRAAVFQRAAGRRPARAGGAPRRTPERR